jgi:hypothetical protein
MFDIFNVFLAVHMHESADKILGKAKRGSRPDWLSLQTLKLADERSS